MNTLDKFKEEAREEFLPSYFGLRFYEKGLEKLIKDQKDV